MNSLGSSEQLTTRRVERELAELDGHWGCEALEKSCGFLRTLHQNLGDSALVWTDMRLVA
jgi:hypothetical protein